MKDARCIFVTGRRGSGKTTLVQSLVADSRRIVAFDPLGEYRRELKWPGGESLAELHAFVSRHWCDPFRFAMTPGDLDFVWRLHQLSIYLWHAMLPYERGRDKKKLLLIVEEMNLSVPVHNLAADRRAFLRLVLQGRHRGIEIIGVSQRPALVSADFRSAAAEKYVLPLGVEDHGIMGTRYRDQIAALSPHHWLRFGDGTVKAGKNRRW